METLTSLQQGIFLLEAREKEERISIMLVAGDAVCNDVCICGDMGCCDPHWIVEHEGALEAPQAATCPRSFAPFDGPSLGGNIVSPEEDR